MSKSITLLGKTYKYNNQTELQNKLGLSRREVSKLIQDTSVKKPTKVLFDKKKQQFDTINISKPIALQRTMKHIQRLPIRKIAKNQTIKGLEILDKVPRDTIVKLHITIIMNIFLYGTDGETFQMVKVNDDRLYTQDNEYDIVRTTSAIYKGKASRRKVYEFIIDTIQFYLLGFLEFKDATCKYFATNVTSIYTNKKVDYLNIFMNRVNTHLSLHNEIITSKEDDSLSAINCVHKILLRKYKICEKSIKKVGSNEGVLVKDLIEFCKKYSIKCKVFKITGECIDSYTPLKKKRDKANLTILIYDGHAYELENKFFKKSYKTTGLDMKVVIVDDIDKNVNDLLNQNILPGDIQLSHGRIQSYIHDNVIYTNNKDYNVCKEVLTKVGLSEYLHTKLTISSILDIIAKPYIKQNIDSFLPNELSICKPGCIYFNEELYKNCNKDDIITEDKNKAYTFCLHELPYLIKTDYRYKTISKCDDNTKIEDQYLYIVYSDTQNLFFNYGNFVYWGYMINYVKKNIPELKFKLIECIETETTENYYKSLIDDLKNNINNNAFKSVFVRGIGKMAQQYNHTLYQKNAKIVHNDEVKCFDGYSTQINNNYSLVYDNDLEFNTIYNKLPINIQIKDYMNIVLYDRMLELGIKNDDIVQIKTDSISYIGKPSNSINLNKDNFLGWKSEKFKPLYSVDKSNDLDDGVDKMNIDYDEEIYNDSLHGCHTFNKKHENENILYDQYAGGGKTYSIIHEHYKDDTLVLAPTHTALKEYRENKIKCDVIQTYQYISNIPEQQNIIIDEVGMVDKDGWDFIYKAVFMGKNIKCFGDFKQLLPVKEMRQLDTEQMRHYLFKSVNTNWTNRRNKFTSTYYDKLINNQLNLVKEVKKYSSDDYINVDVVICYFNKTVDLYNELIMNEKNLTVDSEGLQIMCRCNKLKKLGIYNKFIYYIEKVYNDKKIKYVDIKDILDTTYTIKYTDYIKYFKPAYARTCHSIQGETLNSYHFAEEDLYKVKDNGRLAYTIISRLKQ